MAFNIGSSLLGGLGGAASGASLGSSFPGLGTAVGGGLGGLLGLLGGGLSGGGGQQNQQPQLTSNQGLASNFGRIQSQDVPGAGTFLRSPIFGQEQQSAQMSLLQQALQGLQQQGTPSFGPIREEALRRFSEEGIPSIAERFTSMGGTRKGSSAFGQQVGSARAGLESQLAGQEQQFGQQNLQNLMQMLGVGLQPQFETTHFPQDPGTMGQLGAPLLAGLGTGIGTGATYALQSFLNKKGNQDTKEANPELAAIIRMLLAKQGQ